MNFNYKAKKSEKIVKNFISSRFMLHCPLRDGQVQECASPLRQDGHGHGEHDRMYHLLLLAQEGGTREKCGKN
jgi:hypothetical protein